MAENTLRVVYFSSAHSIITYGTILGGIHGTVTIFFRFKNE
jgi:hypothetical protein